MDRCRYRLDVQKDYIDVDRHLSTHIGMLVHKEKHTNRHTHTDIQRDVDRYR